MQNTRLILSLTMVLLLLAGVACGPKDVTIQTPADQINFSAADLGPAWSLMQESGLDEMPAMEQPHVQDANMRMFSAESITGMVISIVLNINTVDAARQEMSSDTVENFGQDFKAQFPDMTMERLPPPQVGDEAVLVRGNLSDLGINVYMMTFRKSNVIVMFNLIAAEDVATEELVLDCARMVEGKMQ